MVPKVVATQAAEMVMVKSVETMVGGSECSRSSEYWSSPWGFLRVCNHWRIAAAPAVVKQAEAGQQGSVLSGRSRRGPWRGSMRRTADPQP